MDFVKTEEQNNIEEENYDVYMNNLPDYQHTAISMEQLHQAMQSTLSTSSIVHNLQLPLSPRQMSTLMLKTNQLSRNFNFNDIPAHLARNLTTEMNLVHNLSTDIQQNMRHEDLMNQNLRNTLDMTLARNLNSELELQNSLTQSLVQSLNEQELSRNLNAEMNETLSRVHELNLPSNFGRSDHELGHELDLSQMSRQNLEAIMNNHDERRASLIQNNQLENQRLEQSLIQRLDQNIIQRLDPNLIQRLDPNLVLRLDQRIDQRLETTGLNVQEAQRRLENEPIPSMPFHIKMEQEDDSYFYAVNQQINNANTVNGYLPVSSEQTTNISENQVYSAYNNQIPSIPSLNNVDIYSRTQNFTQNYGENNLISENPQNLVVQREYQNSSPYAQEEFKKISQNGCDNANVVKSEETNENLKPSDENKLYYQEYESSSFGSSAEKNENDPSAQNKIPSQDLTMNIRGEYECYRCHKIFPSKRGLKQHAKVCTESEEIDEKIGRFSCSQCAYRCQSPAILKIHERTHTGEKPFACSFCDYKSGQKNNVAKHILVHMKEKPFRCQYCDYRCAQKNNLVVHERTHTGYKPFACPYCDYRTVQKPNLVKHMYLHTDQKPFSCDQCSYRCVQKTNLTKHKQRHLNEKVIGEKAKGIDKEISESGESEKTPNEVKPYKPRQKSVKCPQCSYKCVQKSSLVKHLQFKHNMFHVTDENFEHELAKSEQLNENYIEGTIQNLSVKKNVDVYVDTNEVKLGEPLQIQS